LENRLEREQDVRTIVLRLKAEHEGMKHELEKCKMEIEQKRQQKEDEYERTCRLKAELERLREDLQTVNKEAEADEVKTEEIKEQVKRAEASFVGEQGKVKIVEGQAAALQAKLRELTQQKQVFETELEDIQRKEKPGVRQTLDEWERTKKQIEDNLTKSAQIKKRIAIKRKLLYEKRDSEEAKRSFALRLKERALERKLKKYEEVWTMDARPVTQKDITRRNVLKMSLKKKDRDILVLEDDIASLEKYLDLLETILREIKE
jgi:hypothetical protein